MIASFSLIEQYKCLHRMAKIPFNKRYNMKITGQATLRIYASILAENTIEDAPGNFIARSYERSIL